MCALKARVKNPIKKYFLNFYTFNLLKSERLNTIHTFQKIIFIFESFKAEVNLSHYSIINFDIFKIKFNIFKSGK